MDAKDIVKEPPIIVIGEGLSRMLQMQRDLIDEYVRIEKFPKPVWDMRLKKNQINAKGFIFRVIEELAEAFESFMMGDEINFYTELADATHFILELGIVTGHEMKQEDWWNIWGNEDLEGARLNLTSEVIQRWFWNVTFQLGLVSNAMRNKQWKQTEVLPDMEKFDSLMDEAYKVFFQGFKEIGVSEYQVHGWYWRKNKVNQFRIKSKY